MPCSTMFRYNAKIVGRLMYLFVEVICSRKKYFGHHDFYIQVRLLFLYHFISRVRYLDEILIFNIREERG